MILRKIFFYILLMNIRSRLCPWEVWCKKYWFEGGRLMMVLASLSLQALPLLSEAGWYRSTLPLRTVGFGHNTNDTYKTVNHQIKTENLFISLFLLSLYSSSFLFFSCPLIGFKPVLILDTTQHIRRDFFLDFDT